MIGSARPPNNCFTILICKWSGKSLFFKKVKHIGHCESAIRYYFSAIDKLKNKNINNI